MPVDASIALGVKPIPIESPINQMAKMYEMQNAVQSNQLNQMKMDEYKRGLTEDEAIKNALTRLDRNSPTYEQDRFNAYALKGIEGVKAYAATKKEEAAAEEHAVGTTGKKLTNVKEASAFHRDNLWGVTDSLSAAAWVENLYKDATIGSSLDTMIPKQQMLASIPTDPTQLANWKTQVAMGSKEFAKESMAKPSDLARLQNEMNALLPNDPKRAAYEAAIKKESEFAPVQPPAPSITEIVDPKDPTKLIRVDTRRYEGGSFGDKGVIGYSGKEPTAAAKENKIEAGKSQLQTMIDNMRSYYTTLNEANDIPSTERGGVSNVASWVQGSAAGQLGGRMVGTESQRARTNITNSKLALLNALKQATGKSAQELNSNQELKTNLDALSDVNQGYESAMDTLNNLEDIYIRGVGADKQNIIPKNEKMPSNASAAKKAKFEAFQKSQNKARAR